MDPGSTEEAATIAADAAFLGLEVTGDGSASFTLTPALARPDGALYGGTAIAAAIAVGEQATGRRALWTTVQFVSGAATVGDRIDCTVDVQAHGRRTSQVRVTGTTDGAVLFAALGATAHPKDGFEPRTFAAMPHVPPPDECAEFRFIPAELMRELTARGFRRLMDIRAVPADDGERNLRLWVRIEGVTVTPAVLGYLADWVPASVARAFGRFGGGTSLDNTLRLGAPADTEWVLLDIEPHLARGGYGHGTGQLWSPDGTLLATASQTAALRFV